MIICLVSVFFFLGCNKQEPPQYEVWIENIDQVDPELAKCLKDADIKYKVENNNLYVDDTFKALMDCE